MAPPAGVVVMSDRRSVAPIVKACTRFRGWMKSMILEFRIEDARTSSRSLGISTLGRAMRGVL